MIQVGTNLDITDNSGARVVKCVKVLDKTKQSIGYTGTLCIVSVKSLIRKQKSKVKKGHLYKAVVCETKMNVDGSQIVQKYSCVTISTNSIRFTYSRNYSL